MSRMSKSRRAEWREIQAEARERERAMGPEDPAAAAARRDLIVAELPESLRAILDLAPDGAPVLRVAR